MKKIIYFDIDNTLLNTRLFKQLFYQEVADKLNLPLEKVVDIYNQYKSTLERGTDFYPDDLAKFISEATGVEYTYLKNLFDDKSLYQKSIFADTVLVLEKLKKDNRLSIYSEGFEEYQSKKLRLSGIIDYFEPELMIIKRRKLDKRSIDEIKDGSTVIDDNKEVIEILKNCKNFETVWINRKNEIAIEGVKTIENLIETLRATSLL